MILYRVCSHNIHIHFIKAMPHFIFWSAQIAMSLLLPAITGNWNYVFFFTLSYILIHTARDEGNQMRWISGQKAIKLEGVTAAFASVSFQLPFLVFLMRCIFCDSPLAWLIPSLILLFVIHIYCPFFHSCVHLTFCSLYHFCVDVIIAWLDETVH